MPKFIYLLTIAFVFLSSCLRSETQKNLTLAENLMEENPDSSMVILKSISGDLNRADSAKYALMMTYAMFKLGEDPSSDSLINKAYYYYESDPSSKYWMMSLYYKGYVIFNSGNLQNAITLAMQAHELSMQQEDYLWKGRTSQLLREIYSMSYLYEEALKYAKQAADFYLKANKIRNHRFSVCDIAADYCNLGDYDRCLQLNDSILNIASKEPADEWLQSYAMDYIFWCYYYSGQYAKADSIFSVMINFDSSFLSINDYVKIAEIKRLLNKPDEALQISNQCENYIKDNDKLLLHMYLTKSNIYRDFGDYKKTIQYLDSMILKYNKIVEEILRQPVTLAQSNYYEDASIRKENMINNLWITISTILVFACLIIVIGIHFHRILMNVKNLKISEQLNEIKILHSDNIQNRSLIESYNTALLNSKQKIDMLDKDNDEKERLLNNFNKTLGDINKIKEEKENQLLRLINEKTQEIELLKKNLEDLKGAETTFKTKLETALRKQWKTLNLLCEEYYEKADSEKAKASILKTIEDELKKMRDKKSLNKIENMVNEFMDNVIVDLRNQCVFLSETDILFIMLCYAGMTPRTICFFTGVSLKNYYVKRKRLYERILKSEAPDKEFFAKKLSDKTYKN